MRMKNKVISKRTMPFSCVEQLNKEKEIQQS